MHRLCTFFFHFLFFSALALQSRVPILTVHSASCDCGASISRSRLIHQHLIWYSPQYMFISVWLHAAAAFIFKYARILPAPTRRLWLLLHLQTIMVAHAKCERALPNALTVQRQTHFQIIFPSRTRVEQPREINYPKSNSIKLQKTAYWALCSQPPTQF